MLEFRFDTQLLIEGHGLNEDAIHDYIQQNIAGDCLLAVGDEDLIKIHFHTNTPWKVLEYCAGLGDIHDVVIETWSVRKTACTADLPDAKTRQSICSAGFSFSYAVIWRRPPPRACPARGSVGGYRPGSTSRASAPGRPVRARRRCGSWPAGSFAPARRQNTP